MTRPERIILASSSPYRKALMQRLKIPFIAINPEILELAIPSESAKQLVCRLAQRKAEKIAENEKNALIIGSDQVVHFDDRILEKPGSRMDAKSQLMTMRGRGVSFLTGICVFNTRSGNIQTDAVSSRVCYRKYSDEEIERYLDKDAPYDCAGSFKSEQLGIALVEKIAGPDPTSLIGLPLIKLTEMLRTEGYKLP